MEQTDSRRLEDLPVREHPPVKVRRAAVLGCGLAALICAWDLARKGVGITVFAPGERLGGRLAELGEEALPAKVLEGELARLMSMGVAFRLGARLTPEMLRGVLTEYDAVFVEGGAAAGPSPRGRRAPADPEIAPREAPEATWPQKATGLDPTLRAKVFCCDRPRPDGRHSTLDEVAEARRAASAMDRLMTGGRSAPPSSSGPYSRFVR
ncbi:hypothetical protein JCM15519_30580 [Fundidesulfovibrio butyratiphilus]